MASIHAHAVAVGHWRARGPLRLLVMLTLGLVAVVGAIEVSDVTSRPRAEDLVCDRFAAVRAYEPADRIGSDGNLDDAVAHSRGSSLEPGLAAVVAAAGALRSGAGGVADVDTATRRLDAACRRSGWDGWPPVFAPGSSR